MMHKNEASARKPVLRRPKGRPCEDFWHTLMVGVPIAVILFIVLPCILN